MGKKKVKHTLVVCGFPGVGKSKFFKTFRKKLNLLDSDSSNFPKENGQFPNNYVNYIEDMVKSNEVDIIMVSTHESVLDELEKRKIDHYIVYPELPLRSEYIRRYIKRGNHFSFVYNIHKNWYNFISRIQGRCGENHTILVPLGSGEYLSDIFKELIR